jgi:hypothetical protein
LAALETLGLPPAVPGPGAGSALAAVLVAAARSAYHARRAMFEPDAGEFERDLRERRYRVATVRHALSCRLPDLLLLHRVRDPRDAAAWAPESESMAHFLRRVGHGRPVVEAVDDRPGCRPCLRDAVAARLDRHRSALERDAGSGAGHRTAWDPRSLPDPAHPGWPVVLDCARRGWQGLLPDPGGASRVDVEPSPMPTRGIGIAAVRAEILAAVARLRDRGIWRPNTPTGRVWCGASGIFLLWPLAGRDLCSEAPGLGDREASIAEILVEAGLVESAPAAAIRSAAIWQVSVPRRREPFRAIRWLGPTGLLAPDHAAMVPVEACRMDQPARAVALPD